MLNKPNEKWRYRNKYFYSIFLTLLLFQFIVINTVLICLTVIQICQDTFDDLDQTPVLLHRGKADFCHGMNRCEGIGPFFSIPLLTKTESKCMPTPLHRYHDGLFSLRRLESTFMPDMRALR